MNLYDGERSGPDNMARDYALLDRVKVGRPAARVYGWSSPWVSLGASQKPERALLASCRVPWVARPTGGKAVLHGHDVTVGLCVSLADLGLACGSRNVERAFLGSCGLLRDALRASGVECDFAGRGPVRNQPTSDCFAYASANDLVDREGNKVCGCAQRLTHEAVLVQASVPVRAPSVPPSDVYLHPGPVHWVELDAETLSLALAARLS
jgi:lipoate-protein ligase A